MPDRRGPAAARARDAGGNDEGFTEGVSSEFDCFRFDFTRHPLNYKRTLAN